MLESLLIAAAVGAAVAAVTVTANLALLTASLGEREGEQLYARQLTLRPKADDYEAFYTGAQPLDVREVGPADAEAPTLERHHLEEAVRAAPSVETAYIEDWQGFSWGENDWFGVQAVTAGFQTAAGLAVSEGSLFTEADFAEARNVLLLSPLGAERLGLTGEVVGQEVTFGEGAGTFTVVGLLRLTEAADEDDFYEALMPWRPSPWGDDIREFFFVAPDAARVREAQAELRAYAEATWGEGVVVRSNADWFGQYAAQQRQRLAVLAVFASLGLLVAALNLTTLMLARVLRRQREIGVRRSLGATRAGIRNQFLGEALALGLLGGPLGVALGYGLFALYRAYTEGLYEGSGAHLTFSPWAALGALLGALAICLLFGLYPAASAARVRVADALKEA